MCNVNGFDDYIVYYYAHRFQMNTIVKKARM